MKILAIMALWYLLFGVATFVVACLMAQMQTRKDPTQGPDRNFLVLLVLWPGFWIMYLMADLIPSYWQRLNQWILVWQARRAVKGMIKKR